MRVGTPTELVSSIIKGSDMRLRISPNRQVTLPDWVLDALDLGPGDQLEIIEGPDGFILKPRRIDYSRLGVLKDKIQHERGTFDLQDFREQPYDPSLRD